MFTIYSSVLKRIKFFSGGTCAAARKPGRAFGGRARAAAFAARGCGGGGRARTNLMIFFSFAFIPATAAPWQARSAPLSRGCRLHPFADLGATCGGGGGGGRQVEGSARGANSGYKRRRGAWSAARSAAAERVGGPGRVGRRSRRRRGPTLSH